mgnify:CR=1 FL=1
MLSLLIAAYLVIVVFFVFMAFATTDPGILNKPAAIVAALLWPIVLPVVFVIAQLGWHDDVGYDLLPPSLGNSSSAQFSGAKSAAESGCGGCFGEAILHAASGK